MTGKNIWSMVEDAYRDEKVSEEQLKHVYENLGKVYASIQAEVKRVIVGQETVLEQMLASIMADSHAILEGFPGLGKTMLVRTLSDVMDLTFKRIQCTPDIMPSDITGTYIIVEDEAGKKTFRFEHGPVFAHLVLADEINRATPKSQSALLEAMQERQVTVGTQTFPLEKPFFVLATQNPIEMEGTYPLPEAQLDRFLLKIKVEYPEKDEEARIIDLYTTEETPRVKRILSREQLIMLQELTRKMPISSENKKYVLEIVTNTRPEKNEMAERYLDYGASPRASIGLVLAAKARALLQGRPYVSREDVEVMTYPVLRHRIILNFSSERKGISTDDVIHEILDEV